MEEHAARVYYDGERYYWTCPVGCAIATSNSYPTERLAQRAADTHREVEHNRVRR